MFPIIFSLALCLSLIYSNSDSKLCNGKENQSIVLDGFILCLRLFFTEESSKDFFSIYNFHCSLKEKEAKMQVLETQQDG